LVASAQLSIALTRAQRRCPRARRGELYNLYHVLNHANLFGGGYAAQAQSSIERLLSAVGA